MYLVDKRRSYPAIVAIGTSGLRGYLVDLALDVRDLRGRTVLRGT